MKHLLSLRLIAIILGCLFVLFVVLLGNREENYMQGAVEQHARVVSTSLWNLNHSSQAEYLTIVAKHYDYETISILDHDGKIFLTANGPVPSWHKRILLSLQLIPRVNLTTPVIYDGEKIGTVIAIWQRGTIYTYCYILLILLLILNVFYFYNRLLKNNLLLEDKVEKRTKVLLESERNYRQIFNSTSDAIFIHDTETGKILDVNNTMLEMYGYKREELGDLSVGSFSSNDAHFNQERALEMMDRAKNEGLQVFEWKSRKKSGEIFWTEVALQSSEIAGEGRMLAVVRDISERKKIEDALKQSEEEYRNLYFNAQVGLVRTALDDGKVLECNDKFAELFGYGSREECIDDWIASEHYVDRDDRQRMLDILLKEGRINNFTTQLTIKDGTTIWAEYSSVAYPEKGYLESVVVDISERKKAEQALLESVTRYQTLFEAAGDSIFLMNEKVFVDCNQKTLELFNCERQDIIGASPAMFSPPTQDDGRDSKEKSSEKINRALKGEPQFFEWKHQRKDGSLFDAEIALTAVEVGSEKYMQAIVRDISQRKKLEEELQQAQKMEAIGTLAGGIAHDFNNILTAIFGYTELALGSVDKKEELIGDLREVQKAAKRAKNLVKQILTFSRRGEQEKQSLQISLLVKEAVKLLRSTLPSSIAIRQNIVSQSQVLADPTQIHQIVMNLCTNAYHAMRESGGTLTVNLKDIQVSRDSESDTAGLESGRYIELVIMDTGTGMEDEVKEKLFEPYFTTKEKGEGTGLGLAVVHGIVESCGGKIRVESTLGEGTAFHLYFPVSLEVSEKPVKEKEEKTIVGGQETILFVDDEQVLNDIASEVFPKYGYQAHCFSDVLQALQEFQQKPDQYDMVITDMTMPNMNGKDFAIKIMETRPDIPVVLCTGHSDLIDREGALSLGIREYIEKPLVMSALLRKVRTIFDREKLHG